MHLYVPVDLLTQLYLHSVQHKLFHLPKHKLTFLPVGGCYAVRSMHIDSQSVLDPKLVVNCN